jgi:rhodanese-related sulfurtransferase
MTQGSKVWEVPPADPGMAAKHFKARLATETDASDLHKDLQAGIPGIVVVDCRRAESYEQGHIPGAINLYHGDMDEENTADWSKNKLYVTYCWNVGCNASLKGAFNLASLGFKVKDLSDGLRGWENDGFSLALGKEPGKLE